MRVTVGLVVEGTHDFVMLSPFIVEELKKRGATEVIFKKLQPTPDETGKMTEGGWTKVLAWCQTYGGTNIETFFTPLFADDPACDIIIIHMDGDALEQIAPHTDVAIPETPDVQTRVDTITLAISKWLASPSRDEKLAYAIPVLQTEAWVLAVSDPGSTFNALDAKAAFRSEHTGRGRLHGYYEAKVSQAFASGFVPPKCDSYTSFQTQCAQITIDQP